MALSTRMGTKSKMRTKDLSTRTPRWNVDYPGTGDHRSASMSLSPPPKECITSSKASDFPLLRPSVPLASSGTVDENIRTRYLVSDESDRLLSADFLPQVEPIIAACSLPQIQKCFLSATMPAGAEEIARRWLRDDAVRVVVGVKSVRHCHDVSCDLSRFSQSGRRRKRDCAA